MRGNWTQKKLARIVSVYRLFEVFILAEYGQMKSVIKKGNLTVFIVVSFRYNFKTMRKFQKTLESILKDDKRYAVGAYVFVRMALDFSVKRVCSADPTRTQRHVSTQELLDGIKDFALETFGPMAFTLFEEWGVHKTEDFGQIVFNMIQAQALRKTEEDKIEDFANGFDFHQTFVAPFLPSKKK